MKQILYRIKNGGYKNNILDFESTKNSHVDIINALVFTLNYEFEEDVYDSSSIKSFVLEDLGDYHPQDPSCGVFLKLTRSRCCITSHPCNIIFDLQDFKRILE